MTRQLKPILRQAISRELWFISKRLHRFLLGMFHRLMYIYIVFDRLICLTLIGAVWTRAVNRIHI